jgi:hypothetical protein
MGAHHAPSVARAAMIVNEFTILLKTTPLASVGRHGSNVVTDG